MSSEEAIVLSNCKKKYQERIRYRKSKSLVSKYKKYIEIIDGLLFYYKYNM